MLRLTIFNKTHIHTHFCSLDYFYEWWFIQAFREFDKLHTDLYNEYVDNMKASLYGLYGVR